MRTPISLDEFLQSQGAGFTATLEPIPEKPTYIKVTAYRGENGCQCSASFELPKDMIRSVIPTGKHHYCCGKRLEIAVVEFTENAAVPVAELMKGNERPTADTHPLPPNVSGGHHEHPHAATNRSRVSSGLVGRWPIPWTPCEVVCMEVCTRFCGPTGWDCCEWETRCRINCYSNV